MTTPDISIILPTYNGEKYIRTSIESCINQTFKNFELIIVNDCSTDGTLNIIEELKLKDNRIKIINNQYNKKLPLSLNKGFKAAKGKYHTWTSDDNYYSPDALEKMYKIMHSDITVDLVYADYTLIDSEGKIIGGKIVKNVYDGFTNWLGCGACFLYKKEIFETNKGYDPAAFLVEDYDFFIRAFLISNFYYLNNHNLYYYRIHDKALGSVHKNTVNDITKIMVERKLSQLEKKLSFTDIALLYRKYAIYNAVQKNNIHKYSYYLNKLWNKSKKQAIVTVMYISVIKIWKTVVVLINGWINLLFLLFRKNSKNY